MQRRHHAWWYGLALVSLLATSVPAQSQQILPRDLEIELAESSLPPHLRAGATIYVYEPDTGFEVARVGDNGFHAFVSRHDPNVFTGSWEYREHPTDVLLPIAFDAAGARQPMRVFFDANALLAKGTAPRELKEIMRQRLVSGEYKPHERAGISYMLSPLIRSYSNPVHAPTIVTINVPHRMFYAPHIANDDIGGNRQSLGPYVIFAGPHGYMTMRAAEAEKHAITEEFAGMLDRLCALNEVYCLGQ